LIQEIHDQLLEEFKLTTVPEEFPIPKDFPFENRVTEVSYDLPLQVMEVENPNSALYKERYGKVLKELKIFKDPIEAKTHLIQVRQAREVRIRHPYKHIDEEVNGQEVLLINHPMIPWLAWRLLKNHGDAEVTVDGDPKNMDIPTITYKFNKIISVQDIKDAIADVLGDDIAQFQVF
jgi:hypothetical protein